MDILYLTELATFHKGVGSVQTQKQKGVELVPLSLMLNPYMPTYFHFRIVQPKLSDWLFLTVGGI